MTTKSFEKGPMEERAARDRALLDDATAAQDVAAMAKMCARLIDERTKADNAIDGMARAYLMARQESAPMDAITAVERIAKDAMDFAREVLRVLYPQPPAKE